MTRYLTRGSIILALSLIAAAAVTAAEEGQKPGKPARAGKGAGRATTRPVYLDKEHAPKGKGWIALFDGKDLNGWKHFPENRPITWKVEDGVLVNSFAPGEHGTNIYTDKKFEDFELYYEYCVGKNGNSGVFLRGQYEIQVIDDYGVPSDKPKDWGNGAIYGEKATAKNASKPAGEWQSAYAKIVGKTITVYVNGQKVVDAFTAPRATHLYGDIKVKDGDSTGPILLQGDHAPIKYRYVMIRPITK